MRATKRGKFYDTPGYCTNCDWKGVIRQKRGVRALQSGCASWRDMPWDHGDERCPKCGCEDLTTGTRRSR